MPIKKNDHKQEPKVKNWVQKLASQFNLEDTSKPASSNASADHLSEELATILFIIDNLNKYLLEIDQQPVRKIRETLDDYARELLNPKSQMDRVLFRFRQFFGSYRIAEYTYLVKTFDDLRGIIWELVDQLSEDVRDVTTEDQEILHSLQELRDAVESNSIEGVKAQSRKFIDSYVEHQTKKDGRRAAKIGSLKKNLNSVKKQLFEANASMRKDHLTGAFNRKSFDEQVQAFTKMNQLSPEPICLLMLDIDHFKKINDTFGHAIGDFVLKECVKILQDLCARPIDFVARVGGEEFAILLPGFNLESGSKKAEQILQRTRADVFIHEGHELRFTVSIGIAELHPKENRDHWIKRADSALYASKHSGRNKWTLSLDPNQNTTNAA